MQNWTKKQLYIENKNVKIIILIKGLGSLKCIVEAHHNIWSVNAGEKLQFSPVHFRRILNSLQNETTVKRWYIEHLLRENLERCHTFKSFDNSVELWTIFIHFRFWDCVNGGCIVHCTPERTIKLHSSFIKILTLKILAFKIYFLSNFKPFLTSFMICEKEWYYLYRLSVWAILCFFVSSR